MSVELDITKPPLSKFKLRDKIYHIQYEGLKLICFNCGKVGHIKEACPILKDNNFSIESSAGVERTSEIIQQEKITVEPEEQFGDWMFVKNPIRRRNSVNSIPITAPYNQGKNNRIHGNRILVQQNLTQRNLASQATRLQSNPIQIPP